MKVLEAATYINASPDVVYQALTDFASYGEWCGMFKKMSGKAVAGTTFSAEVAAKNGNTNKVSAKIIVADQPHAFAWQGGLPIPGLFKAVHSFSMQPDGEGTAFSHREEFSGVLTLLLTKKALNEAETLFNAFCADLRERAEKLAKQR